MTVTIHNLASGTLTTSAAAYVTSPPNTYTRITHFNIVNYSGGAVTWTAYRVASGGSPSDANKLVDVKSIASKGSDQGPEVTGIILGPDESLQMLASGATALTIAISGQRVTQ